MNPTCRCRGHGFHSLSRKIPHALKQESLYATTEPGYSRPRGLQSFPKPTRLEPRKLATREATTVRSLLQLEKAPCTATKTHGNQR